MEAAVEILTIGLGGVLVLVLTWIARRLGDMLSSVRDLIEEAGVVRQNATEAKLQSEANRIAIGGLQADSAEIKAAIAAVQESTAKMHDCLDRNMQEAKAGLTDVSGRLDNVEGAVLTVSQILGAERAALADLRRERKAAH